MSWDMVIVKICGGFRPIGQVKPDDYLPLGPIETVQTAFHTAFPTADWSGPRWVVYSGKDSESGREFAIEFGLDDKAIALHAHGPGDPIPSLLRLTQANGWQIVDCSNGQFIEPQKPT
jgi:hypothetical protein